MSGTAATCHPWVALLALGVIGYFCLRNALWIRSIPEPPGAAGTGFLGVRARLWYRECMQPIEEALGAAAVVPNAITYLQAAVAAGAGVAFAGGAMFIGGWLVIAAGTMDVLDGGLARRSGGGTPHGAFVDSVVDRYAELFTYVGLMVYFRGSWMLWVSGLALFGSMMVSYTRARAEGLGVECSIGGAQRPERIVLLGCGAFLSDIVAHLFCATRGGISQGVLGATIVIVAVLSNATAFERAVWVTRRLSGGR